MPAISFDNLLFNRGNTKPNTMAVDPNTTSKTHIQSCIRFASRFIKLRSPLKSSTSTFMRQSTSFELLRDHSSTTTTTSTKLKRIKRAYSSPDLMHCLNEEEDDSKIYDFQLLNYYPSDRFMPSVYNEDDSQRNDAYLGLTRNNGFFHKSTTKKKRYLSAFNNAHLHKSHSSNKLYISDEDEHPSFISQPTGVDQVLNKEEHQETCLERGVGIKRKTIKLDSIDSDSEDEDEDDEMTIKYAKPATAFLVSLSPSAAAAASAAQFRRRRQVRICSTNQKMTLVS